MSTVLINKETSLAEAMPDEAAQAAASPEGSHYVPMVDQQGNLVNASRDQAISLLSQGYTQPSGDQLNSLLQHAKYSSTPERIKTALEGAGEAATFGLSTAVERAYGVKGEDILGRRETNAPEHVLGQLAGLAGSELIPGYGQATAIRTAGKLGAKAAMSALKAAENTTLHKLGSAAVQGAVETALVQGGDEVSKMFAGDPNQSVQSAVADIGLGAFLGAGVGGAFGAASPLWKAANESKLGTMLSAIKNKAEGVEPALVGDSADILASRAGLELSPEIKAAVSKYPESARLFQELIEQPGTAAGRKTQDLLAKFQADTKEAVLSSLGKTEEQLAAAKHASDFEAGQIAQKSLRDEIKAVTDPLTEKFEKWKLDFKDQELPDVFKGSLQAQLGQLMEKRGLLSFPDTEQAKLVNSFIKGVDKLSKFEDLAKVQSLIGQETQRPELWNLGKELKGIFRTMEEDLTTEFLGAKAPEKIAEIQAARAGYRDAMELIDSLNDRLHVGTYAGPGTFLSRLAEMKPEDVVRRLTSKADAGLLDVLATRMPKTAELVKNQHLLELMEAGYKKDAVNPQGLFRQLDKWSPEMKRFALPAESEGKLSAIRSLIDAVPARLNPSGTAGTFDMLMSKAPAGAMALLSSLAGHSPLAGFLLGHLGRVATSEIPAAVKLATLRYLGSGNPISAEAFKVAVDLITATIRGEHMLNAAVGSVFNASKATLPTSLIPTEKQTKRLDEKAQQLQKNPDPLIDVGGKAPHYLPGHGVAMGSVAGRAVAYLNSIRPVTEKVGMLDRSREPSQAEKAQHFRALQIAEQPLMVLKHVKDGTVTPKDVQTIKTLYPDLYGRMSQKIMDQIVTMDAKGKSIPYNTRLSLSTFLQSPLDSTMLPQAIQKAQPVANPSQAQAQAGPAPMKSNGSMKALGKSNKMAMTTLQSREMASTFGRG